MVAISPSGTALATAAHDNTVGLWNLRTGESLRVIPGPSNSVESVAFGPDSKTLAVGTGLGVALFEVETPPPAKPQTKAKGASNKKAK